MTLDELLTLAARAGLAVEHDISGSVFIFGSAGGTFYGVVFAWEDGRPRDIMTNERVDPVVFLGLRSRVA